MTKNEESIRPYYKPAYAKESRNCKDVQICRNPPRTEEVGRSNRLSSTNRNRDLIVN